MHRIAALIGLVLACRSETARPPRVPVVTPSPEAPPLGPLPADVHPTRQALDLAIDPRATRFTGTTRISLHLDHARTVIWLHGRDLVVHRAVIEAHGATMMAHWEQVDPSGLARVVLGAPVAGDVTLELAFDAAYDPQLVGVYRVDVAA